MRSDLHIGFNISIMKPALSEKSASDLLHLLIMRRYFVFQVSSCGYAG